MNKKPLIRATVFNNPPPPVPCSQGRGNPGSTSSKIASTISTTGSKSSTIASKSTTMSQRQEANLENLSRIDQSQSIGVTNSHSTSATMSQSNSLNRYNSTSTTFGQNAGLNHSNATSNMTQNQAYVQSNSTSKEKFLTKTYPSFTSISTIGKNAGTSTPSTTPHDNVNLSSTSIASFQTHRPVYTSPTSPSAIGCESAGTSNTSEISLDQVYVHSGSRTKKLANSNSTSTSTIDQNAQTSTSTSTVDQNARSSTSTTISHNKVYVHSGPQNIKQANSTSASTKVGSTSTQRPANSKSTISQNSGPSTSSEVSHDQVYVHTNSTSKLGSEIKRPLNSSSTSTANSTAVSQHQTAATSNCTISIPRSGPKKRKIVNSTAEEYSNKSSGSTSTAESQSEPAQPKSSTSNIPTKKIKVKRAGESEDAEIDIEKQKTGREFTALVQDHNYLGEQIQNSCKKEPKKAERFGKLRKLLDDYYAKKSNCSDLDCEKFKREMKHLSKTMIEELSLHIRQMLDDFLKSNTNSETESDKEDHMKILHNLDQKFEYLAKKLNESNSWPQFYKNLKDFIKESNENIIKHMSQVISSYGRASYQDEENTEHAKQIKFLQDLYEKEKKTNEELTKQIKLLQDSYEKEKKTNEKEKNTNEELTKQNKFLQDSYEKEKKTNEKEKNTNEELNKKNTKLYELLLNSKDEIIRLKDQILKYEQNSHNPEAIPIKLEPKMEEDVYSASDLDI